MLYETVVVSNVDVGKRLREIDQSKVESLSGSMSIVGLLSPIIAYSPNGETLDLVAGAHRLAAAKKLGWETIDAYIMEGEELHAQLAEVDENLMRSELTPTEYAEHIQRRQEIWEAMYDQSGQVVPVESKREDGKGHRHEGFAESTAKATGKSKKDTNRASKRAREVCQQARDLIRGTKLDTGAFLDGLVKQDLSDEDQVQYVNDALEARADTERRKELAEEEKTRKESAKALRCESRAECINFLHEKTTAREWSYLIDLIDRSGGSISANSLRDWEQPDYSRGLSNG